MRKETLSSGRLLFLGLASHGKTAALYHVRRVSPALRPGCPPVLRTSYSTLEFNGFPALKAYYL